MPTTVNDQFFRIDPANPPGAGTQLTVERLDLVDHDDDGDIDRFDPNFFTDGDTVGGADVTRSWPGDTVTIRLDDGTLVTYTGTTFYLDGQPAVFTPTDGQALQPGEFVSATFVTTQGPLDLDDLGPPCFVAGTRIKTPGGLVPVECLEPDDMVLTLDHGPRAVQWVGRRTVPGRGDFAPVRFAPGVLGNALPLLVSPQHRVLVQGWRAELYLGAEEVLVPAIALVDGDRIAQVPCREVTYVHILFDKHEIVWSEGALTESLYPGPQIMATERAAEAEITALFPELSGQREKGRWPMARPVPRNAEARALAGLHL